MNSNKSKVLVALVIVSMFVSVVSLVQNIKMMNQISELSKTVNNYELEVQAQESSNDDSDVSVDEDDIYNCITANGRDIENIYNHQIWLFDSLGYDWQNDTYTDDGEF